MLIREASVGDAEGLLAIYAPYAARTAITFEGVPSLEEFRRRIAHTLERYPYVVATADAAEPDLAPGRILGYAYAGPFQERPAYDWSAETSIYVDRALRRRHVGSALHEALAGELAAMGITNMYACIAAVPECVADDPHLTDASIRFHERLGYRMVGRFLSCGCKFGRWYDMVWMELMIATHAVPAAEPAWREAREG